MELIPCINCVSVGVADCIGQEKSSRDTFLGKIGSCPTYSDSLYKTCWSLVGVNFLENVDGRILTGSMQVLRVLTEFWSSTESLLISEDPISLPMSAEPVGVPGAALPWGVGSPSFINALRKFKTDKGNVLDYKALMGTTGKDNMLLGAPIIVTGAATSAAATVAASVFVSSLLIPVAALSEQTLDGAG